MTGAELVTAAIRGGHPDDLVMARLPGGMILSVERVEREVHDDADGSATLWLIVEEY